MENVIYLEIEDFEKNGNLKPYVNNGNPVVIMAQGNFCGYCTKAKPAFQQFANEQNQVIACSIEIDGEPPEREAAKLLKKWDDKYMGVPFYLGFNKLGEYVKTHTGNRDLKSLLDFASSLNL